MKRHRISNYHVNGREIDGGLKEARAYAKRRAKETAQDQYIQARYAEDGDEYILTVEEVEALEIEVLE